MDFMGTDLDTAWNFAQSARWSDERAGAMRNHTMPARAMTLFSTTAAPLEWSKRKACHGTEKLFLAAVEP